MIIVVLIDCPSGTIPRVHLNVFLVSDRSRVYHHDPIFVSLNYRPRYAPCQPQRELAAFGSIPDTVVSFIQGHTFSPTPLPVRTISMASTVASNSTSRHENCGAEREGKLKKYGP